LDRDHRDTVTRRIELVNDQHPSPRAKNEPQTGPATPEFGSKTGKRSKRDERPSDALTSVSRTGEDQGQAVEVLDGGGRQLDLGHELQVVERDRVTGRGIPQPKLRTFVGAVDAVKQRDDVIRIGIGLVDSTGQ
jgi:hypothetical protein